MKLNVPAEPIKAALFTENYTEQLTWRDAATGRILAESDFFEPLTINSLTAPGLRRSGLFPERGRQELHGVALHAEGLAANQVAEKGQ